MLAYALKTLVLHAMLWMKSFIDAQSEHFLEENRHTTANIVWDNDAHQMTIISERQSFEWHLNVFMLEYWSNEKSTQNAGLGSFWYVLFGHCRRVAVVVVANACLHHIIYG